MKKNVLIISSSPRRNGNSDLLCNEFMRGATEAGHQAEKIFLRDKTINYCTGCGLCVGKKGVCSQKDDMEEMKDKMTKADVIVLATPVYFYTMAGQLKTFLDRNCFFYTMLGNKEFYYIMTAADESKSSMERVMTEFGGYLDCLDGAVEKGVIYGTGVWNVGEVNGKKVMMEAYEMGRQIS